MIHTQCNRSLLGLKCFVLTLTYACSSLASEPTITYAVKPGESLYLISQKHLLPTRHWQDLADTNKLTTPDSLKIGQRLQIPTAWLAARSAAVKLTRWSGDVQFSAATTGWQPAVPNTQLQAGQRIKLGHNSSAVLLFADGAELVLQPNSELEFDTLTVYAGGYMTDTRMRLQAGRVEVRANPQGLSNQRLDISTPSAITAVRGTQYIVEAQPNKTITQTRKGKVELKNSQGSTLVTAGYGSFVTNGERPSKPSATKPAPVLDRPPSQFTDFPIHFSVAPQASANAWVAQAGPSDKQRMTTLAAQIATTTPNFEVGPLDNGRFQLRTWSLDDKGMPSQIVVHPFEVNIPRQLHETATPIEASMVAKGFKLHLSDPPDGQRYLLKLTKDPQGLQHVWYAYNAPKDIALPPQPDASEGNYYLWIWVY